MNIRLLKKTDKNFVPVFVLTEDRDIVKHPFFKLLQKNDETHLLAFLKKAPIKSGHSHVLFVPSGKELVLIGVSEKNKFNHRKAMLAMRRVISFVKKEKIKNIAINLDDFITQKYRNKSEEITEMIAMHSELANFEFIKYKTPPKEGWSFVNDLLVGVKQPSQKITKDLYRGQVIGEETNKARVLSNTPGGDMTPAILAREVLKSGKESGFKVKVLNEPEIKKLKMGGVIGVAKGSDEKPRFIIMEYLNGKKGENPIVLVGKGVTYDSGGLNLKPEMGLWEMHHDMSGGASAIHTIAALARLGVKKNIIGLVPAVENMPSGSSYRPGDVLKTMNGKTIEILNTDAEGRVILADALEYAKRYNPKLVIDLATLTGAAVSALGQRASAIFTEDSAIEKSLREIGEITGDFVWPLPLWEEYEDEIKGTFGDVANAVSSRYGRAITAAVFLWQFIKGYRWVHIDIAPRMTTIDGEFLAKGSAGPGVALLTRFLEQKNV